MRTPPSTRTATAGSPPATPQTHRRRAQRLGDLGDTPQTGFVATEALRSQKAEETRLGQGRVDRIGKASPRVRLGGVFAQQRCSA